MSRFQKFFSGMVGSAVYLNQSLFLDLGSAHTRAIVGGKLIFFEPTCVAIHLPTRSVVATGKAAAELIGKNPPQIEVIHPIRDGRIVDIQATELFLQSLLKNFFARSQPLARFLVQHIHVAVPANMTAVQQETLKKILMSTGAHLNTFHKKSKALLRSFSQRKHIPASFFVVDIGAMTMEVCLFSQGQVVAEKTFLVGGEHFTQAIITAVRQEHHCDIGWQTAEKVKREIGSVDRGNEHIKKTVVRGRDIFSHLPSTVQFSSGSLHKPFLLLAEDIFTCIQEFCADIPPELIALTLDQGIMLSGGGCVLAGLPEFLMKKMKCPVLTSPTPFEDIIRGMVA